MQAPSFVPGMILGEKYCILETIGEGGTSTVYLVMDLKLRKRWALKRIYKLRESPAVYQAEIDFLKTLNHPQIPRIVDCFTEFGSYCIVMDYLSGRPLSRLGASDGLSVEMLLRWAIQTADLLAYLHTRNPPIIYQDLKPGNLIVQENGEIMLLDFGVGRQNGSALLVATPEYAAPEQLQKETVTCQTDLYNLGRTFQRMLERCTGRDRNSLLRWHFRRILRKCTRRKPSARFASAKELKTALVKLENRRESGRRRAALLGGMVLSGMAAILLTALVLLPDRGEEPLEEYNQRESPPEAASDSGYAAVSVPSGDASSDTGEQGLRLKAETLELLAESDLAGKDRKAAMVHLEEEIETLEACHASERELYPIRLRRAKLVLTEEEEPAVRVCMEALLKSDPGETEPYLLYISYLYDRGDLVRAEEVFRQVSELENAEENPNYQSIAIKLQNAGIVLETPAERSCS